MPPATLEALLRRAGAICLLGVGAGHLQQYDVEHYSAVPTIGTLFVLNAVSAAVMGLALLSPIQRLGAHGRRATRALALAGTGIAAGSLAALFVSEESGLFGFREVGFRPAIATLVILEGATVLLLSASIAAGTRLRRRADARPA